MEDALGKALGVDAVDITNKEEPKQKPQPKQEEPKQDPVKEEKPKPEEPPKQKDEPKAEEQSKEQPAEPSSKEQTEDDWQLKLDSFSKWAGREFKSEDEIKTFLDKGSKASEMEKELNGYKSKLSDYDKLQEIAKIAKENPEKFLLSNESYRKQLKERKLAEGRDPGVAQKVMNSDLNKLNDMDVLSLQMQFNAPQLAGKDQVTKAVIYSDVGVDVDALRKQAEENGESFNMSDIKLTDVQMARLANKAAEARNALNGTRSNVDLPEATDIFSEFEQKEKQRQEYTQNLTNKWSEEGNRLADSFTKFEYGEGDNGEAEFSFKVPAEFNSKVKDLVVQTALKRNLEPNEQNREVLKAELKDVFWNAYKEDIMKAYVDDKVAKLTEKHDDDVHNTRPLNKQERPPTEGDNVRQQNEESVNKMLYGN